MKERKSVNRTEFNADRLVDDLIKRGISSDKISCSNNSLNIKFHKYFEIYLDDDYCSYFNTHWHPYDNDEILGFINDLINEEYIFYHKYRFPWRMKMYKKENLNELLKLKKKKSLRVYSAIKIYIDN